MENITDISSPGFPNDYKDNMICEWNIESSENARIQISVEGFEIERKVLKIMYFRFFLEIVLRV